MSVIKVLVVDDSALMRSILKEILNKFPDIEVVGAASDPIAAREMIKQLNPDVLTLDVEMPRMDGLEFLEKLMRLRPMPVLMVSSLTERGNETTLRALELGAVDFVTKPKIGIQNGMEELASVLAEKIRMAASARIRRRVVPAVSEKLSSDAILPSFAASRIATTEKLIIIGASTGGTEAIKDVLINLPPDCPGILIAQHMPEGFTRSFAQRLDGLCQITVKEATDNERILPGHAYIAPGHSHLLLKRSGANYMTELSSGPPVNRHRPSVDVLFRSAANHAGKNAMGILLTGMGKDGAVGLLEMRQTGSYTIAQNEASCVVFGMPKEAIALGGACDVIGLQDISRNILHHFSRIGHGNRV